MKHQYTLLFWFRKDVRSGKNEGYISTRLTLNGKRAEIATGIKTQADAWNTQTQLFKGNKEEARTLNIQPLSATGSTKSSMNSPKLKVPICR
jgi:hypothetical protein